MDNTITITVGEESVAVGDRSFRLHWLTVGDMRRLTKAGHVAALAGSPEEGDARATALVAYISASLSHHHPECTIAWVDDNMPAVVVWPLFAAVMRVSAMVERSDPKAAAPSP